MVELDYLRALFIEITDAISSAGYAELWLPHIADRRRLARHLRYMEAQRWIEIAPDSGGGDVCEFVVTNITGAGYEWIEGVSGPLDYEAARENPYSSLAYWCEENNVRIGSRQYVPAELCILSENSRN